MSLFSQLMMLIKSPFRDSRHHLIDWIQIAILVFIAPFLLFMQKSYIFVLIVIFLILIFRGLLKKTFLENTILNFPIILLLISIFVSTIWISDLSHSLPRIVMILYSIVFFYGLIALLKTDRLIKAGVVSYLIAGFLLSLLSITGMSVLNVKHFDILFKLKEKIPFIHFNLPGAREGIHPNAVGGILILFIPLFFVLIYSVLKNRKELHEILNSHVFKWFLWAGLIVCFLTLVLTQSRGAWLGLIIGSAVMLAALSRKKNIFIISSAVVSVLFSLVIVYSIGKLDSTRFMVRSAEETFDFRVQIWDIATPLIASHPFSGIGIDEFRYHPEMRYELSHAHNKFIHLAVEIGMPAVIAYMAILIGIGYMAVVVWKTSASRWYGQISLGLAAGQIAYLIFELTDMVRLGSKVGVFFWISAGLITAIYNNTLEREAELGTR